MGIAVTELRAMTLDDVAVVAALEAEHQPSPWSESVFRDEVTQDSRSYVVTIESGQVVGYGGVMLVGDEAHITNLFVAPQHRRRGLGRRMMLWLIQIAVAEGAGHLTLEVRNSNEAARSMYASLGLAPVGVRPKYYADDDALIMWVHDIDQPQYLESLE